MGRSYRNQIRLGEPLRTEVQKIKEDVAETFGVQAALREHSTPSISLLGPYNSRRPEKLKETTRETLAAFDVVPFRVTGFGHFDERVVYATVVPSPKLFALREQLATDLRPVAYNLEDDSEGFEQFHITIAYKDIERQFDDIWSFVTENYELQREAYATRVTTLERRRMVWEWDLPRGVELRQREATTDASWRRTRAALGEQTMEFDHDFEDPNEQSGLLRRATTRLWEML